MPEPLRGQLQRLAGLVAFLLMRLGGSAVNFIAVYWRTVRQLALPIVTIAFILAIAQIMNYAGMTSSMAIALSKISPHNLSVGAAGVNKVGSEGAIFRQSSPRCRPRL